MKRRAFDIINHPGRLWILIGVIYAGCSFTYAILEDKGPIEGLWWGIVTGSTVGYGDFYPASTAGRGVGSFLICSMLLLVPIAIGHVIAKLVVDRDAYTHEEQERSRLVDDETNALVRWLIAKQYGEEQLRSLLVEIHESRSQRTEELPDFKAGGNR